MISAFTAAHVVGVILGMGVAAIADLLGLSILFGRARWLRTQHLTLLHGVILSALFLILASGGGLISMRAGAWCAATDNPLIMHFGPLCLPNKLVAKLVLVTVLVGVALLIESQLVPISRRPGRPLLPHLSRFEIIKSALIGSASLTCWSSLLAIPLVKPLHSWPLEQLLLTALGLWLLLAAVLSISLIVAQGLLRAASRSMPPSHARPVAVSNEHTVHQLADRIALARRQVAGEQPVRGRANISRGSAAAGRPVHVLRSAPPRAQPTREPITLESAFAACRPALIATFVMSALINVLMLSGPLYMLQVYDRVMTSRSIETLVLLTLLLVGLYVVLGVLDSMRGRILSRISIRLDRILSEPLLASTMRVVPGNRSSAAGQPMADLEKIRQFVAGPAPPAMLDLPWAPLYFAILFLLHVYLGLMAVAGALLLVALSLANQALTRGALTRAGEQGLKASAVLEAGRRGAESVQAMGMAGAHRGRWSEAHRHSLSEQMIAGDIASRTTAATRVSRMLLQSLMLAAGAYLAIDGVVSMGAMIASSIIAARALAPIELLAMQWQSIGTTRAAVKRCRERLAAEPTVVEPIELPEPAGSLEVSNLFVAALGGAEPVLKGLSFRLSPGDALAVVGPSASGKSTLARALVGVWNIRHGDIRLDGAALAQWPPQQLGRLIGYVPQEIALFDGTLAENIARLDPNPEPRLVIAAARSAGVHEMILRLPKGYATQVGEAGAALSGGQRQRIALARALYGNPALVVMDEPNANLDGEGEAALVQAIAQLRKNRRIVVVMAHRNSIMAAVNRLLVLKDGRQVAFGEPADVFNSDRKQKLSVVKDANA